jgi:hypothetical protein
VLSYEGSKSTDTRCVSFREFFSLPASTHQVSSAFKLDCNYFEIKVHKAYTARFYSLYTAPCFVLYRLQAHSVWNECINYLVLLIRKPNSTDILDIQSNRRAVNIKQKKPLRFRYNRAMLINYIGMKRCLLDSACQWTRTDIAFIRTVDNQYGSRDYQQMTRNNPRNPKQPQRKLLSKTDSQFTQLNTKIKRYTCVYILHVPGRASVSSRLIDESANRQATG